MAEKKYFDQLLGARITNNWLKYTTVVHPHLGLNLSLGPPEWQPSVYFAKTFD